MSQPSTKDTSVIPKGIYCHGEIIRKDGKLVKTYICPYWRKIEDRPEQANGWCDFLEKGDIELEHECTVSYSKLPDVPVGTKIPMFGLLWDQVKECGINKDE